LLDNKDLADVKKDEFERLLALPKKGRAIL
jgi:hypothetical protein